MGPFDSRDEVRDLPEVRAAWDAVHASPGQGRMQQHGQAMIAGACKRAGVALGAEDRRVLLWLASVAEPEQCAVLAAMITRAAAPRPRMLLIDLSAPGVRHVLTEALERYEDHERDMAENEGGNDAREGWANTASRLRGLVEDAMNEPQGPAAEGGTES